MQDVEGLPTGSVLLHIGPPKTGSTAIQAALAARRDDLPRMGVAYPRPDRELYRTGYDKTRAASPSWSALSTSPRGFPAPGPAVWSTFAASVAASDIPRVCVSSETFAGATKEQAAKIVGDLGGDNVHVIAAVRPLDRILPSHWQQQVKVAMETRSYEEWLRATLDAAQGPAEGGFWRSQSLPRLIETWTSAVGAERLTLVMLSDRDVLPRTFETMLQLPSGYLDAGLSVNESLSWNAAELLRRLNLRCREEEWPQDDYLRLTRPIPRALSQHRGATGAKVGGVPEWAVPILANLDEQRVAAVEEWPGRVVGDASSIRSSLGASPAGATDALDVTAAVDAMAATMRVAIAQAHRRPRTKPTSDEARSGAYRFAVEQRIRHAPLRELLTELAKRPARRLSRRRVPALSASTFLDRWPQ